MPKPNSNLIVAIFTLTLSFVCGVSWADHGRDFLLVETARLGEAGNITGIMRQDYVREEGGDVFVLEPLLSWTARDWLSLEINGDAEKEQDETFNYEATVPGLRLRFTPKYNAFGIGASVRYKIASDENGSDAVKISGLTNYEAGGWLFAANLIYEKPHDAKREWGYAAGVKRELRHHLSIGLEVAGNFEKEKSGEVLMGMFYEPIHGFQMNAGIGTSFNSDTDVTVRTAFIWTFR